MTNIKIVVMEVRGSESSASENKWRIISRGIQSKLLPHRPTSPPSIAACFFFSLISVVRLSYARYYF